MGSSDRHRIHPNNYALIVGVQDYDHYQRVPGAQSDARALIHQCLAMGFAPARIRVLTSPVLSPAEVGIEGEGVSFAAATRADILDGLAWIYGALAGAAPAAGLLTFSGHGLIDPDLVLCPSGFDGSTGSAVLVSEARPESDEVAGRLTVFFDCCHAQGGAKATGGGVREALASIASGLGDGDKTHRERLLAACGADQVSVSSRFGGVMMGAFTWAVTAVLGQWRKRHKDRVAWLDIACGELRDRVEKLLQALSFQQVPVLSGPQGTERRAFLHPDRFHGPGATSAEPTATLPERQIGPGVYTITIGGANGTLLGNIYATGDNTGVILKIGTTDYTLEPNREYWYLDSSVVKEFSSNTSLYFTWEEINNQTYEAPSTTGDVATARFYESTDKDENSVWATTTTTVLPPDGSLTSNLFVQNDIYLQMIFNAETGQIGGIYWYQSSSSASTYLITPKEVSYSYTASGPAFGSGTWYASLNAPISPPPISPSSQ